jgi:disease resistance protein RPM1
VCKSIEDNFVTVHGIPRLTPPPEIKVRRLSLQGKTDGDVTVHLNQNYANVRSIVSFGFPCSLLGLRFLCVLDFTDCQRLLENHHLANIGELLQLRYLNLRQTSITELPEQIGALQYLETLDISFCSIIQLPTAIVRLKRLVNLLMGPEKVNCFPSGIKNMQALEELKSVHVDIKAAAIFVEEIGYLTKMRHLGISFFSISGIVDEERYVHLLKKMVSSFQQLNKLQTLDVRFDHNYGDAGHAVIFDGDDVIIEVPWCSGSLRKLCFRMSPMSRVPSCSGGPRI